MMKYLSAEQMAISHMTQEFKSIPDKIHYHCGYPEVYFVFPTSLATKLNRRLNRMLGIHKINKQK